MEPAEYEWHFPHDMQKIRIPRNTQETLMQETVESCSIVVEEGAQLRLIAVQLSPATTPIERTIELYAGASLTLFTGVLDSIDVTTHILLEGNDASVNHAVLYFGSAKQRMNIITNSTHRGKNTLARTRVRGVVVDHAQVNFRGSIAVTHEGSTHGSSLSHEGLLMSHNGRIDALPGLEVATNDVRAAHSSAIHYIRPDQLFYLQTRGLPEPDAKRMIIAGFTQELLQELPDASLVQQLEQVLKKKKAAVL